MGAGGSALANENENVIFFLVLACAGIEFFLFIWFCSLGQESFMEFISSPDTPEYKIVALKLVENGELVSSRRTLGYPLFLALGYLIGGENYGAFYVIVVQLSLNILFTYLCWKLLQQTAPTTGIQLRSIATLVYFYSGLGLAFYLLSDFLASFFFGIFLYGILFWRSRTSILLSAPALGIATLIRPTFTLIPVLLPGANYLIRQFTSKVPAYHTLLYVLLSLTATGISISYQYKFNNYMGPSPILVQNIRQTLYFALEESRLTLDDHKKSFEEEVSKESGRRYEILSLSEQEKYARKIFFKRFISHPWEIVLLFVKTFVKYIFAPIENILSRILELYVNEQSYSIYFRPVIGLICLPIWIFSMTPPLGYSVKYWKYYYLVMILLCYVLGVTIVNQLNGERIRFPVLPFMLPLMVWNIHHIYGNIRRRLNRLT